MGSARFHMYLFDVGLNAGKITVLSFASLSGSDATSERVSLIICAGALRNREWCRIGLVGIHLPGLFESSPN
jgi:hypothetical protein